jgi:hypothetical protein
MAENDITDSSVVSLVNNLADSFVGVFASNASKGFSCIEDYYNHIVVTNLGSTTISTTNSGLDKHYIFANFVLNSLANHCNCNLIDN